MEYVLRPIEKDSYDVIVVGGGIAGIAASVSAARGRLGSCQGDPNLCTNG